MAVFLLTPLREGRRSPERRNTGFLPYFYSRPCGRGDACEMQAAVAAVLFLLTPLREGRQARAKLPPELGRLFLLTPLREGRRDI